LNNASVYLGSYRQDPLPGRYTLRFYDEYNRNIFEKNFLFDGSSLSISHITEKWWKEETGGGMYSLVGFAITAKNFGDLPAYPHTINVVVDNEEFSSLILPSVILPGTSNTLYCSMDIRNISAGVHIFKLSLKNSEGYLLANKSYTTSAVENVSTLEYTYIYKGQETLLLPDPEYLYDYYNNLDRPALEDYAAYVFDTYDDQYIGMIAKKFSERLNTEDSDVTIINAVTSLVQRLRYAEDDLENPEYEYPRYPIEMLKDEQGDCEDKAILTAAILDKMGYNVSLLRLPKHMAVGVHLDENASKFDYYIGEYYYLETTRANWVLGRVPQEYKGLSNVTVYPISHRPIILHTWKSAIRFTSTNGKDFVKMHIIVENLGSKNATNIEVRGAFFSDSTLYYNQEVSLISSLSIEEKKEVDLHISVPRGITTTLKTQIYLDNNMVDEKESSSTFS